MEKKRPTRNLTNYSQSLIILKTRGSRIRAHRKLWRWLGENPERRKSQWPEWERNGGRYKRQYADCFLCYYQCSKCPLIWPSEGKGFKCIGGECLFTQWSIASTLKEKTKLALQIAELPIRRLK